MRAEDAVQLAVLVVQVEGLAHGRLDHADVEDALSMNVMPFQRGVREAGHALLELHHSALRHERRVADCGQASSRRDDVDLALEVAAREEG